MKKTAKPAAKKAPKLAPIIIGGLTGKAFHFGTLSGLIDALPAAVLKEQLRARSLAIPKDKATMVARLANWAGRPEATFTLELR